MLKASPCWNPAAVYPQLLCHLTNNFGSERRFLKYYAECSVSWDLTGGVQVSPASLTPERLAVLEHSGAVTVERAVPFSFYQNVVTLSYSMAFWEWDRYAAVCRGL